MDASGWNYRWGGVRIASSVGVLGLLGGCLQTAPVVVTPQEQQSRVVYSCPNAKSIDVTRVSNGASAIVVVDGQTLQLNRDGSSTSAERYTNRIQTLTIYGGSATFESLGRTSYGPCTGSGSGAAGGDGNRNSRSYRQDQSD